MRVPQCGAHVVDWSVAAGHVSHVSSQLVTTEHWTHPGQVPVPRLLLQRELVAGHVEERVLCHPVSSRHADIKLHQTLLDKHICLVATKHGSELYSKQSIKNKCYLHIQSLLIEHLNTHIHIVHQLRQLQLTPRQWLIRTIDQCSHIAGVQAGHVINVPLLVNLNNKFEMNMMDDHT